MQVRKYEIDELAFLGHGRTCEKIMGFRGQVKHGKESVLKGVIGGARAFHIGFKADLLFAYLGFLGFKSLALQPTIQKQIHKLVEARLAQIIFLLPFGQLAFDESALGLFRALQMGAQTFHGLARHSKLAKHVFDLFQHFFLAHPHDFLRVIRFPAAKVCPLRRLSAFVNALFGIGRHNPARCRAGQKPAENKFLTAIFELLFMPAWRQAVPPKPVSA
ncbi:MAG: hypothetical protein H6853_01015 [Rhodospirillales bacterium]|nr:hypothetical protein [Alphaproteobacteria bacterium]USO03894.1 MAG: hypothetical protein H6853_01015 [Rhodospirillales bacterium]